MNTNTAIYHWTLGEVALARITRKIYARVKIIKNEDGIFYGEKGISGNEDGSIAVTKNMCYYVETSHTKIRLWIPYTSMHLAERSRPFYGTAQKVIQRKQSPDKVHTVPKKRKVKVDHTLPLSVKPSNLRNLDFNTTYDIRHVPLKQGRYENAFNEFVRRGKEKLFDEYFKVLQDSFHANKDVLDYLLNVDASTETKTETVLNDIATEKEIENYLHQCWRYNFLHKMEKKESAEGSNSLSPVKQAVTVHTSWCLVCGKGDRLHECTSCPSTYHLPCRREWLVNILHRKNPPQKSNKPTTFIKKILSSTRTICSTEKNKENIELCPSCMWGPKVGYDDVVWNKLGACSWWPARVLTPGATPSCLLTRNRSPHNWPLKYYGTLNHSWGESSRTCLFLPTHTAALDSARDPMLRQAVLDACDDYIAVYLT